MVYLLQTLERYQVIVIGGGPAGLMAALTAQHSGAKTLLLEKGDKLGRKLGISGGGRCNVTNAKPLPELMENIPGNARFLYSALHQFSNQDIMQFFENLGIRLKEEDRGRVFPVSDKASTVVKTLVDAIFAAGVEVWTETPVHSLSIEQNEIQGVVLKNGKIVLTNTVVLATGGCSVPKTGSTGDAYPWAKQAGHSIIEPYPTEVPLTSTAQWIQNRELQGLSLRNIALTIRQQNGKRLTTEYGDMIFTHFGLSGPAALRCSHYVSTALRKGTQISLIAEINLHPEWTNEECQSYLLQAKQSQPKRTIANILSNILPNRLVELVLRQVHLAASMQIAHVTQTQLRQLIPFLLAFPVQISGTLPLAQATVTGGGVHVKEIDPKSMHSKLCQGLFFAGEVMDVHAHTGGYNITVAFSTGRLAGLSAANHALLHTGQTV